jgi:hypothetical protein
MTDQFKTGFEKIGRKKKWFSDTQKEYAKKVILPATLAFWIHGAAFAPKGKRLIKFLESGTRGLLTGTVIGGAAHLKKQLEKGK